MDLEKKRKRIEGVVKILALLVVGFVVYPFIFMALKGLLALIAAVFVGALALTFTPWMAAKLANWRLKAIKHEAAQNPIETLENVLLSKEEKLAHARENLRKLHSIVQNIWDQIQEHNSKFPNSPSKNLPRYEKLRALLNLRGQKYKAAADQRDAFAANLEEKRSDWQIAQSMAEANQIAQVGEDFHSKLMADTALIAVQDGLNSAFAELDMVMLDNPTISAAPVVSVPSQIPEKTGPPLDVDFDFLKQPEPVAIRK